MYASIGDRLVNVLLFYFDSRNEAGSLNIFLSIFFFVLKYRRQFKWRQTDYGSKSGHCQFFFPSYCQYRSFETWVKMKPVNFGSLEYRGIFISLSPNTLAPWAAPISRISNLTKEFSLLLYLFDFLLWRWWTRKESSISFPGHSLVSSCFQFCQKFCDLVAKKWKAMDCVYAIDELR